MIERKLRKNISISENRFDFMPGRSTIKVIYLISRLMQLYRDRQKNLHMVFIDLEKAYNKILWGVVGVFGEERGL